MKHSSTMSAGALALAGVAGIAVAQNRPTPATTDYWITADTGSGMAGMMQAGRAPDPQAMMRAMMSGGGMGGNTRSLALYLGSPRQAAAGVAAEHAPPAGLGAGTALPLVVGPRQPVGRMPMGQMERPRGRILVYWGCGDRARAGQPVTVDLARIGAAGNALAGGATVNSPVPPSSDRYRTLAEWPNARSSTQVGERGSLVGDHAVRGPATPDMRFTVAAANDFLGPVRATVGGGAGALPVSWAPVPNARGWLVNVMGGNQNGDVIIWSSSEVQLTAMSPLSHLPEAETARLVQQRVLLAPATTRCTVPAEVAGAAQGGMLTVTAFGPEGSYAQPRPANAPAGWTPEWRARLLTASRHMAILGMDMGAMQGMDEE